MKWCNSCKDWDCFSPLETYNVRDSKGRFTKVKVAKKRSSPKKTVKKSRSKKQK